MDISYTKEKLILFEENIADLFNKGKIRAPVHLYYGNENEIINVFQNVQSEDWVFCSWRSHYQCLLKGVPEDKLRQEILEGKSISLCFPEYRIYSSAIVGGSLPIALGVAFEIKRKKKSEKVFCFIGDMTAETGIAHETIKYALNFNLPIIFIIEDNGQSVVTDTKEAWGMKKSSFEKLNNKNIIYYKYDTKYPHAGAGKRVEF